MPPGSDGRALSPRPVKARKQFYNADASSGSDSDSESGSDSSADGKESALFWRPRVPKLGRRSLLLNGRTTNATAAATGPEAAVLWGCSSWTPDDDARLLARSFANVPDALPRPAAQGRQKEAPKQHFARKAVKLVAALIGIRRAVSARATAATQDRTRTAGLGNLVFFPSSVKRPGSSDAVGGSADAGALESACRELEVDAAALLAHLNALKGSISALPPLPYFLSAGPTGRKRPLKPHEDAELVTFALSMVPHYLLHSAVDDLQFLVDRHPAFSNRRDSQGSEGWAEGGVAKVPRRLASGIQKQLAELRSLLNLSPTSAFPSLPSEFNRTSAPAGGPPAPHNSLSIAVFALLAQLHLHSQLWHSDPEFSSPPSFAVPFHAHTAGRGVTTSYPDWFRYLPALLRALAADLLAWSRSRHPNPGPGPDLGPLAARVAADWLGRGWKVDLSVPCHRFLGLDGSEEEEEEEEEAVVVVPALPGVRGLEKALGVVVPVISSGRAVRILREEQQLDPTAPPRRNAIPSLARLAAEAVAVLLPDLAVAELFGERDVLSVSELLEAYPSHVLELIREAERTV
ncbi:hypothetical protein DFJ74DRAFT_763762 [Hyaloraphidium curvatum]|nr:hypothetical protein DFJ74DRAFT_763762 [Hyaloraphidium curvatum]